MSNNKSKNKTKNNITKKNIQNEYISSKNKHNEHKITTDNINNNNRTNKSNDNKKNILSQIKKFWNYVWNGDDAVSWILSLIVAFIIIKFIFYPLIGLLLGTSYPIVAVVSGSMEHKISDQATGIPTICGKTFEKETHLDLTDFWNICGFWYESNTISKENFEEFHFSKGINKGDVIVLRNPKPENIKVGDVVVFVQQKNPGKEPIIHRVVNIKEENNKRIFQTKGDHNADSINITTQNKYLNEYDIKEEEIIGRAVIKIPFIGYIKIWAFEAYLFARNIL